MDVVVVVCPLGLPHAVAHVFQFAQTVFQGVARLVDAFDAFQNEDDPYPRTLWPPVSAVFMVLKRAI